MWFDQCGAVVQNCNSALLDAIEEHPPHYFIYIYIHTHIYSVFSRIFSSCGGRTISHGPRPLPTQESHALRIEFIITKKDK